MCGNYVPVGLHAQGPADFTPLPFAFHDLEEMRPEVFLRRPPRQPTQMPRGKRRPPGPPPTRPRIGPVVPEIERGQRPLVSKQGNRERRQAIRVPKENWRFPVGAEVRRTQRAVGTRGSAARWNVNRTPQALTVAEELFNGLRLLAKDEVEVRDSPPHEELDDMLQKGAITRGTSGGGRRSSIAAPPAERPDAMRTARSIHSR